MTNYKALINHLQQTIPGLSLCQNEPLSGHTSFQIGGSCAVVVLPSSEEQLTSLLNELRSEGVASLIIGRGTNLLVTDAPLDCVVIKLGEDFSHISDIDVDVIYAQAGCTLTKLAAHAARKGLAGLEFAHGIPGSVGGAVVMNAGAYGGEMKNVVSSVRVLSAEGDISDIPATDCGFAYRHSAFSDTDAIMLGCTVTLNPGDPEVINGLMRELAERRRSKQPLDKPSAGSTFKRPTGGYASALIEQAGLKGYRVGGAAVSDKHAGFVVNLGGATYADVRAVMGEAQRRVYEQFGIRLEPEVKIIEG